MLGDPSEERIRERVGVHVYIVGIAIGDAHLDAHVGDAIVNGRLIP